MHGGVNSRRPPNNTEDIMWKTVSANPKNEVSDSGEVRNRETGYVLKPWRHKGYPAVDIRCNGKKKKAFVHRLVAEAFIPNPDNLPCVNHKDENKANNNADNLEWCTVQYNNAYGSRQTMCDFKRGKAVVAYKDGKPQELYWSIAEAARAVGCNPKSIRQALFGEKWVKTIKGYEWRFFYGNAKTNKANYEMV